ncbi:MAG TPA: transposase family protein [Micromonosporaceae bacterium]|nr:transposase family protein [Micromonosporaceae bacterium]
MGTRRGTRKLTCFYQAVLVLVWFRKGGDKTTLGAGFGVSRATTYRYVAEAVAVLAAQTPTPRNTLSIGARCTGASKLKNACSSTVPAQPGHPARTVKRLLITENLQRPFSLRNDYVASPREQPPVDLFEGWPLGRGDCRVRGPRQRRVPDDRGGAPSKLVGAGESDESGQRGKFRSVVGGLGG